MEQIFSGRTVDEAIDAAVKALNVDRDSLRKEIIEYPSNGLFGIGRKLAKIKVIVDFSPEIFAEDFIKELFLHLDVKTYSLNMEVSEKTVKIQVEGADAARLVEKESDIVDAIQILLTMAMGKFNSPDEERYKAIFDVEGARDRKIESLEALAVKSATRALKEHKKVYLSPMSSYQRRIIHSKLQDFEGVTTFSVGEEPNRKVVIAPASGEKSGRGDRRGNGRKGGNGRNGGDRGRRGDSRRRPPRNTEPRAVHNDEQIPENFTLDDSIQDSITARRNNV